MNVFDLLIEVGLFPFYVQSVEQEARHDSEFWKCLKM